MDLDGKGLRLKVRSYKSNNKNFTWNLTFVKKNQERIGWFLFAKQAGMVVILKNTIKALCTREFITKKSKDKTVWQKVKRNRFYFWITSQYKE